MALKTGPADVAAVAAVAALAQAPSTAPLSHQRRIARPRKIPTISPMLPAAIVVIVPVVMAVVVAMFPA